MKEEHFQNYFYLNDYLTYLIYRCLCDSLIFQYSNEFHANNEVIEYRIKSTKRRHMRKAKVF